MPILEIGRWKAVSKKQVNAKKKKFSLLHQKKGETLMEAITSIFIFSVTMTAVATMIATAAKINTNTTRLGSELQNAVNHVAVTTTGGEEQTINFTLVNPPFTLSNPTRNYKVMAIDDAKTGLYSFYPDENGG